jgi:hypothetical protein
VQQGEQHPLAAVEAVHLGEVGARPVLDEPQPAVAGPGQHVDGPQLEAGDPRVEPADQRGERRVQVERARLVDDPRTAGEPQLADRAAAPVRVAGTAADLDQRAGIGADERGQGHAVGVEAGQQLGGGGDRVQGRLGGEPGEHRVAVQQVGQPRGGAGPADEVGEARFRGLAGQDLPVPCPAELQHQGAGGEPGQLVAELRGAPVRDRSGVDGGRARCGSRDRGAGRVGEGAEHRGERRAPASPGGAFT